MLHLVPVHEWLICAEQESEHTTHAPRFHTLTQDTTINVVVKCSWCTVMGAASKLLHGFSLDPRLGCGRWRRTKSHCWQRHHVQTAGGRGTISRGLQGRDLHRVRARVHREDVDVHGALIDECQWKRLAQSSVRRRCRGRGIHGCATVGSRQHHSQINDIAGTGRGAAPE